MAHTFSCFFVECAFQLAKTLALISVSRRSQFERIGSDERTSVRGPIIRNIQTGPCQDYPCKSQGVIYKHVLHTKMLAGARLPYSLRLLDLACMCP